MIVRKKTAVRLMRGLRLAAGSAMRAVLVALAASAGLLPAAPPAWAAGKQHFAQPYVVRNDRGGLVRDRLRELHDLRASGRPVEIRGRICFSTCTMLLGLPQTCIDPETVFGFHGPSRRGRALPPEEFEYYSQVIAQYYPKPLRNWYIEEGRTRIRGIFRIRGREIIRMGLKSC